MRISQRLKRATASQTVALDAIAKQLIAEGKPVINLTAGELDMDTSPAVLAAAKAAVDGDYNRYSSPQGLPQLRTGIANYMKQQYGIEVNNEQVIVTNGVKQAMFSAMQTLVNPGDEVLVPSPGWVSYVEQIQLAGGVAVPVETDDSFVLQPEAIAASITERTVGMVVNSPSNPTGVVMQADVQQHIAELAKQHGWWVVSDEIYDRLVYEDTAPTAFATLYPEGTITVNGLSKAGAMTGWRVGFAAGPVEVITQMTKLQSHLCGNVNNIAQQAAVEALQQIDELIPQYLKPLRERRQLLLDWVEQQSLLSCVPPDGAFYCFVNISRLEVPSEKFCERLLQEHNVGTVPGVYFGREGHVRISFANDIELLEEALQRINTFIAGL